MNTDKVVATRDALGGRKFIIALICCGLEGVIFITMLILTILKFRDISWLTGERCMAFVYVIPTLAGIFCASNVGEKVATKWLQTKKQQ